MVSPPWQDHSHLEICTFQSPPHPLSKSTFAMPPSPHTQAACSDGLHLFHLLTHCTVLFPPHWNASSKRRECFCLAHCSITCSSHSQNLVQWFQPFTYCPRPTNSLSQPPRSGSKCLWFSSVNNRQEPLCETTNKTNPSFFHQAQPSLSSLSWKVYPSLDLAGLHNILSLLLPLSCLLVHFLLQTHHSQPIKKPQKCTQDLGHHDGSAGKAPDNVRSISGNHIVEGEQWLPRVSCGTGMYACIRDPESNQSPCSPPLSLALCPSQHKISFPTQVTPLSKQKSEWPPLWLVVTSQACRSIFL